MGQHPVAQRARTPAIDLFAKGIRHYSGDAHEPDEPGEPTHRQPTAGQHAVKSILPNRPDSYESSQDGQSDSAGVPRTREWIAFVNVPADGVSLIPKDKTQLWSNLVEVFDRVNAHQCARRTILLARILFASDTRRIEWSVFTKVALDRDQIVSVFRCGRWIDLESKSRFQS